MINDIEFDTFNQNLLVNKEKKNKYGEIFTPFSLIKEMFDMFPQEIFSDKNAKWLDPGAGTGFFSIYLFFKLDVGLEEIITDKQERHKHIIKKMIFIIEIQEDNCISLFNIFGKDANIINNDFIKYNTDIKFDFIIGNPPYNANGLKKVPTNSKEKKTSDGETMWIPFIKKSISLLKDKGKLLMIIPSIWMKPDKAKTYYYLMNYKILKLRCFNNTETNKIFLREAQTPTCILFLSKETNIDIAKKIKIELYDKQRSEYILHNFNLNNPIPVFGVSIINKIKPFIEEFGGIKVIKSNTPKKNSLFSDIKTDLYKYPNIKTAILKENSPQLIINYSNSPQSFFEECKIVLPHKMYGFPYIDKNGIYGISNRDNYIIKNYKEEDLQIIKDFLSTKTALYIFETTRYRMKYLEKYAFEFVPDIKCLLNIEKPINDKSIAKYFNFDEIDKKNIQSLHNKEYKFIYNI
tara:strand:+ start:1801 stop:3189 length:1389 start_codon:yes stop_codon:yes gene_type:complete